MTANTKATNGLPTSSTVPGIIKNKDIHFSSTFTVHAPATGAILHDCAAASIDDALTAVTAAQEAFESWKDVKPSEKRKIFLKAADILESRAEELGSYMVDETGAPGFWGAGFNVPVAVDGLRDVAGRIGTITGSIPTAGAEGTSAMIVKEPYGVILGIAPWNAPYILGFRAVSYAIAAGNTAILKAPEFSPRCYWAIGDVFRRAGLPAGVLNVIAHRPSDAAAVTKALIEDTRVKKVNFTGSTAVGRIIAKLAGASLKPVLLELGGKAPAIVWEDANLQAAAAQCAMGAFLYSGQICMSTERVVVHKNVAKDFETAFAEAVKASWSDAQVLNNKLGVEKNQQLLKDAIEKGAKVVVGHADMHEEQPTQMRPVVISGVKDGMDFYGTESFAPTVSVIEAETEEEALRIANDTEYGLSSAIFTEDLRRGLRMAKKIETGAVHINSMSVHDEAGMPHGGCKSSGFGRFGSIGLDEWVLRTTPLKHAA